MKYVDLFCGMGSFAYSFDRLGFECVMACDINPVARRTFEENFGVRPLSDIENIEPHTVPDHDVMCAGFPCQPFSHAGHHRGFEDARGTMFFHVLNIASVKRPKFIVLENVPGLLTHDLGRTFETITRCLRHEGYVCEHAILRCCDFGIPQLRKRLFVVARRDDAVGCSRPLLELERYKSFVSLSEYMGARYDRDVAFTIRCGGRRSGINDRHNWDTYMVDGREYTLTLADALHLQGFDATYKLEGTSTQKWKLLGNTIPTVFTRIVGECLLRATGVSEP